MNYPAASGGVSILDLRIGRALVQIKGMRDKELAKKTAQPGPS